jgi:hypothetical protein
VLLAVAWTASGQRYPPFCARLVAKSQGGSGMTGKVDLRSIMDALERDIVLRERAAALRAASPVGQWPCPHGDWCTRADCYRQQVCQLDDSAKIADSPSV